MQKVVRATVLLENLDRVFEMMNARATGRVTGDEFLSFERRRSKTGT